MKLESIAAWLEANPAITPRITRGKSIFVHAMPASCTFGVMLREYFGGTDIDPELPGFRRGTFQLIVRSADYAQGRALAEKISEAMNLVADPDPAFAGFTVKYLRPRSEPLPFPKSIGDLWEFLVNFDTCYVLD